MPDSIVLNGPQGTSIQVGTWLQADPGPDFGEKDLLKAALVENPLSDGAAYAYESVGARHMVLPLVMASGAAGLSLTQIESLIRDAVRPGATLDVQPQGVASSDAVRFDVLHGRLEPNYDIRENRVGVRHANVKLDVQPYGYWPTMVQLGSAASIGLPGRLIVPGASIISDTPAQAAQLTVAPGTTGFLPTQYAVGTAYAVDLIGWALSGHGASAFIAPSAWVTGFGGASTNNIVSASVADSFAPLSTMAIHAGGSTLASWAQMTYFAIGTAIEPLYRGRFHAFGYFKLNFTPSIGGGSAPDGWRTASTASCFMVSLDAAPLMAEAVNAYKPVWPMASSAAVATIANNWLASPGYQLIDLGPITLPPQASGAAQSVAMRLWARGPNGNGHPSHGLAFAGLVLLPIDAPAGIQRGGVVQPTVGVFQPQIGGRFFITGRDERSLILAGGAGSALPNPTAGVALGVGDYRGGLPFVGASTVSLEVFGGARPWGNQWPYVTDVTHDVPDGYWRFNDPANASALVDSSGHGNTIFASYPSGLFFTQQQGALGNLPPDPDIDFALTPIPSCVVRLPSYTGFPTSGWTVECWFKPPITGSISATVVIWNAISGAGGSQKEIMLGVNPSGYPFMKIVGAPDLIAGSVIPSIGNIVPPFAHLVFAYTGSFTATPAKAIYLNGSLAGSAAVASAGQYLPTVGVHNIGRASGLFPSYMSGAIVDELAVYPALLSATTVAARIAAFNGSSIASVGIPIHVGPAFGPVSVHYQPRFFFQKGF